jgi:hypothetical protein
MREEPTEYFVDGKTLFDGSDPSGIFGRLCPWNVSLYMHDISNRACLWVHEVTGVRLMTARAFCAFKTLGTKNFGIVGPSYDSLHKNGF